VIKIHKEGCEGDVCECEPVEVDCELADKMMKERNITLRDYLEIREKNAKQRGNTKG
jgi:predicted metal-binding transcription factor (methanogenesis marker protein 9)